MTEMLIAAKAAKRQIAALTTEEKNAALNAMADALLSHEAEILSANEEDMIQAKGTVSDVMLDRLKLTADRIAGIRNAKVRQCVKDCRKHRIADNGTDETEGV